MFSKLIHFLPLLLLLNTHVYSEIITIPQDANTIHEAVARATSGDEIHLMTDVVHWGGDTLTLSDMELTIKGVLERKTQIAFQDLVDRTDELSMTPLHSLDIQSASITFENIAIGKPAMYFFSTGGSFDWRPSIMNFNQGSFSMINSEIHTCLSATATVNIINSTSAGYNQTESHFDYSLGAVSLPAINWRSENDDILNIINSNVVSQNYNTLMITDSSNSNVLIYNSYLKSGNLTGSRGASFIPGEEVIIVENCFNINFIITNSTIKASDAIARRSAFNSVIVKGERGGDAFHVINY